MKTRAGFVSNSSTSSFVIVGFMPGKTIAAEDLIESLGLDITIMKDWEIDDFLYNNVVINPFDEGRLMGQSIAGCNEGDMEEGAITIESVIAIKTEIERIRDALGIDAEVKIYSGTGAC